MAELVLTERETDEGTLVSVADAAVIGETFENGDVSLTVTESFYRADGAETDATVDRVVESLSNCATANLVGEAAVTVALDHGFVEAENVLEIDGTLHAQLVWV